MMSQFQLVLDDDQVKLFERALRITYMRLLNTGLVRVTQLTRLRVVVSDAIARAISNGEGDEWRAARRGLFAGCALLMADWEVERPPLSHRSLKLVHNDDRASTAA